jgi:protocatechuate 3,4-dioxygenase beta subunit
MKTENTTMIILAALFMPLIANAQMLKATPSQVEGPFYPGAEIFTRVDNDMASNGKADPAGKPIEAAGEKLIIQGSVLDRHGMPVVGAEIQLWQTDGLQGRYLVEQTYKFFDPNFKYAAISITDSQGDWAVETVRPIEYEADVDWIRPSHIHVKVFVKGQLKLITQIYFSDEMDLINKDKIIQQLPPELQKLLIVQLTPMPGHQIGKFDIVLK